jgi:hypothetical protein
LSSFLRMEGDVFFLPEVAKLSLFTTYYYLMKSL